MQGELRITHRRRGGEHLRMIRDGGAVDLRDGLAQLLACRGDVGAGGGDRVARVRELFLGDGAVRQQSAAALQVLIRGALRLFTLVDLRAQLLALRKQAAHLADRAGEIRFGIGHGDFRIGGIEREQRLPRLHALGVIDVQRQHRAGDLARHLHHVAVDVGIVGGFVVPAVEEPVRAVADRAEYDGGAEPQESGAPRAVGRCRGLRVGGHFGFWRVHGLARVNKSEELRRSAPRRRPRPRWRHRPGGDRSCRRRRAAMSPARPPGWSECRPWTGAR